MSSIHFSCTLCGQCCHGHSLPLTMEEAVSWLESGGMVAVYCEAIHSLRTPLDPRTAHRQKRGFAANCGSVEIYVTAILVAVITGACMNLGEDMKCRIYERRPLVCRIYPAEISPFVQLDRANKVCPPEAWPDSAPQDDVFGKYLPSLAEKSRQTDYREALLKGMVCAELGIATTAVADEGYVRHFPEPELFLAALKRALAADGGTIAQPLWKVYSPALISADSRLGLDVIGEKPAGEVYQFLRA